MGLIHTDAIVLNSRRLGEADKIITLFTNQRGKVRAVANGARKPRSRFGASLEPFMHSSFVLYEKRPGALLRVSQSGIVVSNFRIRLGLESMLTAGRMVRLTSLLAPDNEANPRIYSLLCRGLSLVAEVQHDPELLIRFFEIQLLKYSGYLPRTDQCLKCRLSISDHPIFFSAEAGGTLCQSCSHRGPFMGQPISRGTLSLFTQTMRLGWDKLDRIKAGGVLRDELRDILEASLSSAVGRPVS